MRPLHSNTIKISSNKKGGNKMNTQKLLNKKLVDATLNKDVEKVKILIEEGADMYYGFKELEDAYEGGNAWGIACSQYFYEDDRDSTMFDLFEKIKDQKKLESDDMDVVLLTASKIGDLDKVIEAIESGADIEANATDDQPTPLIEAIEMVNIEVAEYLINKGADVNAYFMSSEPILMRAIITGNTQIAKLLIDKGADIYATSGLGRNIIGIAAQKGNKDIISILLKRGVDPFEEDERGMKPVEYARKYEHKEIEEFFKNLEKHRSDL
jgi:hypothetical protein